MVVMFHGNHRINERCFTAEKGVQPAIPFHLPNGKINSLFKSRSLLPFSLPRKRRAEISEKVHPPRNMTRTVL